MVICVCEPRARRTASMLAVLKSGRHPFYQFHFMHCSRSKQYRVHVSLAQAANELLKEGAFAFAAGGDNAPAWPPHLMSLTVLLGNPQAFSKDVR